MTHNSSNTQVALNLPVLLQVLFMAILQMIGCTTDTSIPVAAATQAPIVTPAQRKLRVFALLQCLTAMADSKA